LNRLDRAHGRGREQDAGVLLADVDARGRLDRHRIEVERDVGLRLCNLARVEGVHHGAARVAALAREQGAQDLLVHGVVGVAGGCAERGASRFVALAPSGQTGSAYGGSGVRRLEGHRARAARAAREWRPARRLSVAAKKTWADREDVSIAR